MRRLCGECNLFDESLERSKDGLSMLGICSKSCKQKESLDWCEYNLIHSPTMARKNYIARMYKLELDVPEDELELVITAERKNKNCLICGKEFKAYPHQKWCSKECRKKNRQMVALALKQKKLEKMG